MKRRTLVSGAAGMLVLAPLAVGAQATIKATPRTNNTGGNMCLQLEAGPSRLSGSPEGLTVLRMKAELEAVEQAMRADPSQHRQFIIVQGRLDSVGRMITGAGEPSANRFIFEARPGSAASTDGQRIDVTGTERMMVSTKLRELQPQVAELTRGGAPGIIGMVNIRLNTLGYVGLTATAGTFPMTVDPLQPFAYCDYPRVESVEVGSPADRAGLLAGDTLVAYNGRDLRQTNVNYPDLLIPGKPLAIRYRRDGRVFNANMIVAARDVDQSRLTSMGACTEAEAANGCKSDRVVIRAGTVGAGGFGTSGGALYNRSRASAQTGAVMAAAPRTTVLVYDAGGGIRLAGALIRAIDEQTAQNMGTDAGLFVIELPVNTPSYQAGLRSGDWVLSVNGSDVRDVSAFRKAVEAKGSDRVITLQVTSKTAGSRTITIQW